MTVNTFDRGDALRLGVTIKKLDVLTDPDAVSLVVQPPSGAADSYSYSGGLGEVKKTSTGVYYCDLSLDESGAWWYRWTSTGAAEASEESHFRVKPRAVA